MMLANLLHQLISQSKEKLVPILNELKTVVPQAETQDTAVHQDTEPVLAEKEAIPPTVSYRLFRRNGSSSYSGPETIFENEAWAPGRSGLFHKRWHTQEESEKTPKE